MARTRWRGPQAFGGGTAALNLSLGRYPGPVWTMVLWLALAGANLSFALLRPISTISLVWPRTSALGLCLVGILVLLVWAERTPAVFLQALVSGSIVGVTAMIATAATITGINVAAWGYAGIALYVAYWTPLREALTHVTACAVLFASVLILRGLLGGMVILWVISMSACFAIAGLLSSLIGHLQQQATTDALTGLGNRTGMAALLERREHRGLWPRTLVLIDLDDFKLINDRQGHLAGDHVLRNFGALLRERLRTTDVAIRSGGDEFLLVLHGADVAETEKLLSRLRSASEVPWSYGVADWPEQVQFDEAHAQADMAMYAAKTSQREDPRE